MNRLWNRCVMEVFNGILRTLVNEDNKKLEVVTLNESKEEISNRLRIRNKENVNIIKINRNGLCEGKRWIEHLY